MKKHILFFCMIVSIIAKAQTANDTIEGKLNVYSSLGLGMIDNSFRPASGISIQTSTGFEYRLSRRSSVMTVISFDSYGYQKSGTSYNLDGSLKTTALALFYRYKFGANKVRPYVKAGGGGVWIFVPTVTVAQGTTSIKTETEFIGIGLAEAGVQLRVLSRYSLLLGVERGALAKSSLLDNTSLGTTTFKVGLISAF